MTGTTLNKINFGAGPASLPDSVLKEARAAIENYNNSGLSILEIPHRGRLFAEILEESEALVKDLARIDNDYHVLWLHGGGRLQFAMIPMNFLGENESAGYIDSGHWAADAMETASYYGKTEAICSSKKDNYSHLPELPKAIDNSLSYLHITTNNTIFGTQWNELPNFSPPLIADMSSDIFSRERNYSDCSLFYAVAQKNIGPAGATLVVIHKDMLTRVKRSVPPILDYKSHIKSKSLLNTPPVFPIYVSMLMLRWTREKTIPVIERESIEKSNLLYNEIDRNSLFSGTVTENKDRSRMNVCFTATNASLEEEFLHFCKDFRITGIKGHRFVGGFRASLYNAVSVDSVKSLVRAMQEFEKINK
jgi:phosphoserine aminotransferase